MTRWLPSEKADRHLVGVLEADGPVEVQSRPVVDIDLEVSRRSVSLRRQARERNEGSDPIDVGCEDAMDVLRLPDPHRSRGGAATVSRRRRPAVVISPRAAT